MGNKENQKRWRTFSRLWLQQSWFWKWNQSKRFISVVWSSIYGKPRVFEKERGWRRRIPFAYSLNFTKRWLHDDCLTTARRKPDNYLTTARRLLDDQIMANQEYLKKKEAGKDLSHLPIPWIGVKVFISVSYNKEEHAR